MIASGQPQTTGLHIDDLTRDIYEFAIQIPGPVVTALSVSAVAFRNACANEFFAAIESVVRLRRRERGETGEPHPLRELHDCTIRVYDRSDRVVDGELIALSLTFPK